MSVVFKAQAWAIQISDGWVIDGNEEAVAFFPQNVDDEALLVSAYYKDSEIVMDEMRNAIQSAAHDGSSFSEIRLGDFVGCYKSYSCRDDSGQTEWRVWCLYCHNVHLYITYNCTLELLGVRDEAIDQMLRTLSFVDSQ